MSIKRTLDFGLGLALFIVAFPVILLSVLIVKLTSRGPAIYRQTRTGLYGERFTIYKLRTMYDDCERLTGPRWSTDNDPRVTPFGRFLRATHLDELPQLWNVIRGDMSLVGPRPERPEFICQLEKIFPRYGERLTVLPGVTGLAQINLPPDTDHESVRRKLVYDLYYVENAGPWFDLRIMACTALFFAGFPFAISTRLFGLRIDEIVEPVVSLRGLTHEPAGIGAGIEMEMVP